LLCEALDALVPLVDASDLLELLLPQAAPARASAPTSAAIEAFVLMGMCSLSFR
jgi:hypothetical protein